MGKSPCDSLSPTLTLSLRSSRRSSQIDNHSPGSPYPVAVYSDNVEGEEDAVDVIVVIGDGGAQGIKIVKIIDVTFCKGFALSLDLVFLVRLQLFYKFMKARLGSEGVSAVEVRRSEARSAKRRAGNTIITVAIHLR